jgi:hypothetical protein
MPSIDLAMKDLAPVWRNLTRPTAEELRRPFFAAPSNVYQISAFVACLFVMGEGAGPGRAVLLVRCLH